MRKIRLYLDWYPGMEERFAFARTSPLAKSPTARRYAIDVVLPEDPNDPDCVLAPEQVKRVLDAEQSEGEV